MDANSDLFKGLTESELLRMQASHLFAIARAQGRIEALEGVPHSEYRVAHEMQLIEAASKSVLMIDAKLNAVRR